MEAEILAVKYVGPVVARKLAERGITQVSQLAETSVEELATIPGVGANTAQLILNNAKMLAAEAVIGGEPADEMPAVVEESAAAEPEPSVAEETPEEDAPSSDEALMDMLLEVPVLEEFAVVVGADEKPESTVQKLKKKIRKARKKVEKYAKALKKLKKASKERKKGKKAKSAGKQKAG